MKRDEIFRQLEPPPFGLERLRARMERERGARGRRVVAFAVLASAVVVVVGWPRRPSVDLLEAARHTAVESLVVGSQAPVEALERTSVAPLESSDPSVVLYRVSSVE